MCSPPVRAMPSPDAVPRSQPLTQQKDELCSPLFNACVPMQDKNTMSVVASVLAARAQASSLELETQQSCLHFCMDKKCFSAELLRFLVKSKAAVDSQDINGFTPLLSAVRSPHVCPACVSELVGQQGRKGSSCNRSCQGAFNTGGRRECSIT